MPRVSKPHIKVAFTLLKKKCHELLPSSMNLQVLFQNLDLFCDTTSHISSITNFGWRGYGSSNYKLVIHCANSPLCNFSSRSIDLSSSHISYNWIQPFCKNLKPLLTCRTSNIHGARIQEKLVS